MTLGLLNAPYLKSNFFAPEIERIVDCICSVQNPSRIILFGSIARNRAKICSDIDLLILYDDLDPSETWKILKSLRLAIGKSEFPIDLVLSAEDQFLKKAKKGGFWQFVLEDGKIIYSKGQYDTKRTNETISQRVF